MSFYRFNDTVTLYTPFDDETYEHHVITATKVEIVDSDTVKDTVVTVYLPIYGRRTLKYIIPSERRVSSKRTFTVKAGQKLVIGKCVDSKPPSRAFDVKKVEAHLVGSHHAQHIKITAYNIPIKEEEEPDVEIEEYPEEDTGEDIYEESNN